MRLSRAPRRAALALLALVAAIGFEWTAASIARSAEGSPTEPVSLSSASDVPQAARETVATVQAPADVQDLLLMAPTRPQLLRLHVQIEGEPFRRAWRQRIEEILSSVEEAGAGIPLAKAVLVVELAGGGSGRPEELAAAEKRLRKLAPQRDHLTAAELTAYLNQVAPVFVIRERLDVGGAAGPALFPLLDLNGDGRLSAGELAQAEQCVRCRDFNDDQLITERELIVDPELIAAAQAAAGKSNEQASRELSASAIQSTDGIVFAIGPDDDPHIAADAMLHHYDQNHDGKLIARSPGQEIVLAPAILKALDLNQDGALERGELVGFVTRRPDLELDFAFGRATHDPAPAKMADGARVRLKLDGGYKITLADAVVDFRRNNRNPAQDAGLDLRFSRLDRDKNGSLNVDEINAIPALAGALAAIDVDGDQRISRSELKDYVDLRTAAISARLVLEVSNRGQDLFTRLDANADGVLASRELRNAADLLRTDDRDGDGSLSGEEIPLQLRLELARGIPSPREEQAVATVRMRAAAVHSDNRGPLWFRKMDRNGDGDLTAEEFLGPPEAFSDLDADHDGLIQAAEAERADRRHEE